MASFEKAFSGTEMAFFEKLAYLVKSVQNEVSEIKDKYAGTLNSKDEEICVKKAKALLVAKDLQKETKEVKLQMQALYRGLNDDDGFLKKFELCSILLEKQMETVEQIEQHIQKYGYQPLPKHSDAVVQNTKSDDTFISSLDENEKAEDRCKEMSECEWDRCAGNARPADNDIRIPRLEDFGLCQVRLDSYRTLLAQMEDNQSDELSNNRTIESSVDLQTPVSLKCGLYQESVMRQTECTPCPQLSSETRSDGGQKDITVPVPPVLCTPGVKQFKSSRERDDGLCSSQLEIPEMPELTFNIRDLQEIRKPSASAELQNVEKGKEASSVSACLDSPENKPTDSGLQDTVIPAPPVLCTPGVKQFKISMQKDNANCSLQVQIPDMPDFTFNVTELQELRKQLGTEEQPAKELKQSSSASLDSKQCEQTDEDSSLPELPSSWNQNIEIPETPELTECTMKCLKPTQKEDNILKESASDQCEQTESDDEHIQPEKQTSSFFEVDETSCNATTVTERTRSKNRLDELAEVKKQLLRDDEAPEPSNEQKKIAHCEDYCERNSYKDKENINHETDKSNQESHHSVRLAPITQFEYENQPDFVCRLLSLDMLNCAMAKIEQFFTQQLRDGKRVCAAESALKSLLGANATSLLLVVLRLGRLKQVYIGGHEKTYMPIEIFTQ